MPMILRTVLILILGFYLPTLYAEEGFAKKFHALVEGTLPNSQIGIIVQDPKTGKILFEERAKDYFYPASNTKILTSIAALKFFGPDFQYVTSLHATLKNLKDKVLNDDVYLLFQGDPTFSAADLLAMFSKLKSKGVDTIAGNIVIDDTCFEEPAYAPGWTWDSIPWYYSAPVTSIILNENKVRFKLSQPQALYQPIAIEQDDKTIPPLKLNANVRAVSLEESEYDCRLNVNIKHNDIELTGCWPIDKTPTMIELALDDPRKMASDLIMAYLKQLDIALSGKIIFSTLPKKVPTIAAKDSQPLKTLLFKVLADSNNLYAESLTKALGLVYLGEGSFQKGTHAIQTILTTDTKIDFSKLPLSDGSGQSRYDLVSPYMLMELLNHMYHDRNFSVFYNALSTNGKNGTLSARMKTPPLTGKIVAKTGSATGTSALSGYFTANNGKEYIFSVIINQSDKNSYHLKSFEDALCTLFIQENWNA